ncbi:MAG: hypothetical protein HC867_00480 [Bacteroidia bacterium]|nr:hypothetical protein [Bacteroidia bacterium]
MQKSVHVFIKKIKKKKIGEKLLEKGLVSFLGSDCHKDEHLSAMDKALENPYLKFLNRNKILNDNLG